MYVIPEVRPRLGLRYFLYMKYFYFVIITCFLTNCGEKQKRESEFSPINYVSLTSELIDSIGFTFYDDKQVLYQNDSTFIIYPDGNDLVFYHFETRKVMKKVTFSIAVENSEAFSVESLSDMAVYYGEAIIRHKNGVETIIELGDPPANLYWRNEIFGFEYFSNQNTVVLGLSGGKWPGKDTLNYFLRGLCAFNLNTREINRLPFEFSNIYRSPDFWGAELYTSRKGDTLVISENWSEQVYLIDLNDLKISQYDVRHSAERISTDLPINLDKFPQFKPIEGERKTEKYALWELRHFYYEKYYKAFISSNGKYIYRFYKHRAPQEALDRALPKMETPLSIVKYGTDSTLSEEFLLPADRFYMAHQFWVRDDDVFDHIKFVYTK